MKVKIVLIVLLFCPLYFYGWGKEGHRMISEIAEKNLNPGVEKTVQHYLGSMSFYEASVWMDEMRSDKTYDYMKPWHYLDIAKGSQYAAVPQGDIVSELQKAIKELRNYHNMKDEEVNMDLKMIFHLCGDITQPLHCGYPEDKGGNTIKVEYNEKNTNLHRVWDTDIIVNENITTAECMKIESKWTEAQKKSIETIDVISWMKDSRSFLDMVYSFKNDKIDQEYVNRNKIIIEQQLCKGGLMLASVLNEVFKN